MLVLVIEVFDIVYTLDNITVQETALAIAEQTGHEVIPEALFHEILRPSVVRGKVQTDPEVKEVIKVADSFWRVEGKRHSDEENFYDLKNRAIKALEYLVSRKEETIVVVTHGTILKMMLAVMMKGNGLEPDFWDEIDEFFFPQNTGITWVEYDNQYHPNRWQLITWNDHAHLG